MRKYCIIIIVLGSLFSGFSMNAQEHKDIKDKSNKSDPNIPIFEIKNDLGQTVFAVYPGGVHIFIDDTQLKATGGGFKVGRIGTEKATLGDILTIAPGEVNVYLDNPVKATGGGFKVGRIGTEKAGGVPDNYLTVTPDSTRVYVNQTSNDGFAVGEVGIESVEKFLDLTRENYFIGHNSGRNTVGLYNLFLGYESGFANTSGIHNTFLGYQSGYLNEEGFDNVYIGYQSGYISGVDGVYKNYRNVFIGPYAGYSSSGVSTSVYIGYDAGRYNVNGARNTFVGGSAGANNTIGYDNTFFGNSAGEHTGGIGNTYIGSSTGWSDTASFRCTYIGTRAGEKMVTKSYRNTFLGGWAGQNKTGGDYNTFLGFGAGQDADAGSGNIFIGYMAGQNVKGSNKLYIDNSNNLSPLIYGNFQYDSVIINGNFHVEGNVTATGTIIPDYVFENEYKLESIEEHASFMWNKKHLPAMKSAEEIKKEGRINMNERRENILEELEKAHIYIEQLHKRISALEAEKGDYENLKKEVEERKALIKSTMKVNDESKKNE